MVNNLRNKIFLLLKLDKFIIVVLNSNDELVYKKETLTNNKSKQIGKIF